MKDFMLGCALAAAFVLGLVLITAALVLAWSV